MDYKSEFQSDDDFDCSNGYSENLQQQSSNNAGQNQFNTSQGRLTNTSGLSKAELRKTNKPIMEKRRRARINHCLNELKSLILEAMKKDPARHTKLEKADILEMTVKHLQSIQRQQLNMALQTDPTVIHKFKTGFMECADEVNRYVSQLDGVEESVRQRLNSHLNSCATGLEQIGSMTNFSNGYRTGVSTNLFANANNIPLTVTNNGPLFPTLPQDLNNNPATGIQMGGVQLIPSRLPSGEFALIVPNTANNNTTTASAVINSNSNPAFPTWNINNSSAPANNKTPINDFAANFKRLSAFSKPQNSIITPLKVPAVNSYPQTTLAHANYNQLARPQHQQTTFHTTNTSSPPLSPISSASSNNEDSVTNTCTDFATTRSASPRQQKINTFSGVFVTPPSSAENSFVLSAGSLQQQQVSSTSSSDLNCSTSSSLKRSFSEIADSSIYSEDEHSSKKYRKIQHEADDQDNMWRPYLE